MELLIGRQVMAGLPTQIAETFIMLIISYKLKSNHTCLLKEEIHMQTLDYHATKIPFSRGENTVKSFKSHSERVSVQKS